jgi:ATP-dependent helicase Lhr and Lhr-like helicase
VPFETATPTDAPERFFASRGWAPLPFQRRAWQAYLEGRSGLICVPTGAGKTYAAFGGPLAELAAEHEGGAAVPGRAVTGRDRPRRVRVLYVTPLRAVSRDIELALRSPVAGLALPIDVESRTGDTPSSVRVRQRAGLPEVLITTPESLCLLLSYADAPDRFASCRAVIVDEWHELLSSKRGTQVELALARLRRFAPGVRTWALSATLGNIEEAARAAVGAGDTPILIHERIERPVEITTVLPSDPRQLPWAGHLGLRMLPAVLDALDPERATLLFTNTRAQAELWHSAILAARPEFEPITALHHGSVDRAHRERVEAGLKSGELRFVVATSSLDLGVDFAPVDRVFQIGSPKGIARLLQRAGRSGHRPGEPCRVFCVPTHAMELVEVAAVRDALEHGRVEARRGEHKPLDVLAQHMVTCALGGGFVPDEFFDEVRTAQAFAGLTRGEFDWTLELVTRGGSTLHAYPEFHKVALDERGVARVPGKRAALLHRLNVGTITGQATLSVRVVGGRTLGSIEENFIAGMRRGQKFLFAGRVLEFVRLHESTAYVRRAHGRTNFTPHWAGTRLPISESLGRGVRRMLEAARDHGPGAHAPELEAVAALVRAQAVLSAVPDAGEILVELLETREGAHCFIFPFDGRLVHGGIGALTALRLGRIRPATFAVSANDYGFELLAEPGYPFSELLGLGPPGDRTRWGGVFSADNLVADAHASVNLSELAKRQFREVARIAGLVVRAYPGSPKSARQLTASSSLIFEVFEQFDPGNLLLHQARREVFERQFEQSRMARTLARLRESPLVVTRPERPTPLAFPLMADRFGAKLAHGTLAERIDRMQRLWEREAARSG